MFDFDLQLRFWRGMTDAMLHGTQATLAAASEMQDQLLAANAKSNSATAASRAPAASVPPVTSMFSMAGFPQARLPQAGLPPAMTSPLLWWLAPWQSAMSAMVPGKGATAATANPFAAINPFFDMTPWFAMWMRPPAASWPTLPQMMSMGNAATAWPGFNGPGLNGPASQLPWANWLSMWGQGPAAALGPMAAFWPWSAMGWTVMQTPLTAMMMSAGMPYKVASPSAKASTAAMDAAHAARQQMDKMYSAYRSDGGHAAAQIAMMPWTIAASLLDANPGNAAQTAKPGSKIVRH